MAASEIDDLRATERARLQALLNLDMDEALRLHADDFQLVTPLGVVLSKEQYLRAVEAGDLRYLVWEPTSTIEVRVYECVALIRYRADVEIEVQGRSFPRLPYWFIDAYENNDGRWQVVWSQGTGIAEVARSETG